MKNTNLKSILFMALAAGFMTSCVNDDDYAIPSLECVDTTLQKTKEVSEIPAGANITQYLADDVIEAYVTSSDEGGNFYKTISMQTLDGTKAFSVPVDVTSSFINFEPGRKVFIKMKDLYTDVSNGGMRIGGIFINASNVPSVGRLSETVYRNVLKRSCTVVPESSLVQTVTVAEAKNDAMINKLIEIEGVQFSDAAITSTYYDVNNSLGGATNHLLVDSEGNSVIFRTSSFANYAGKPVAAGRGKVRGVMTKFNTDYQFMVRTENDIQLTGERLAPLFSENFESIAATGNNQFIALPGWSNVSINSGAETWEARIFSGNKYAQMSAFGTGENAVDTRLITPAINLDNSTAEFMRFGYKTGFANGVALSVWYSTDYDGSGTLAAVNAATWTQFPITLGVQDTSYASNFYSSGNIDLSGINGNVFISFRYEGSTNGVNTTYQVDNIEIFGE
ncbi:DUF5689 domain-containing protein [Flavobacterium sp.]|uniref:DUF5689 domain-containing protein n=1 Tax=Flavobacterium sp. TaxID=239 RepID=UPI0026306ACB|nr:DUF5689 domain-containing protein [Flavobacterium sp.]MDD2984972.1 DUF5689 domain-containing protein [Flavobacterium sp.]